MCVSFLIIVSYFLLVELWDNYIFEFVNRKKKLQQLLIAIVTFVKLIH